MTQTVIATYAVPQSSLVTILKVTESKADQSVIEKKHSTNATKTAPFPAQPTVTKLTTTLEAVTTTISAIGKKTV